ncbi:hypothetical protein [Streptomyces sp. NPDC050738]|uniref:hypothetical protein n=1 Tax=Streptomyces sp. NPDC050738 TaxID=3154744 RepID=UPI0034179246
MTHLAPPNNLWVPPTGTSTLVPTPPDVLPNWALERVRTEFCQRPDRLPAALLRVRINDTAPGMDARATTRRDTGHAPGQGRPSTVLLAELHPDTLPTATPHSAYGADGQGALDDGWPGFFHRAHRLLQADDLLLIATRQRRDAGRMTDPLGLLISTARTAGFRYLQHLAVVHGTLGTDTIHPTPPDPTTPELIHSDLLVLDVVTGA